MLYSVLNSSQKGLFVPVVYSIYHTRLAQGMSRIEAQLYTYLCQEKVHKTRVEEFYMVV